MGCDCCLPPLWTPSSQHTHNTQPLLWTLLRVASAPLPPPPPPSVSPPTQQVLSAALQDHTHTEGGSSAGGSQLMTRQHQSLEEQMELLLQTRVCDPGFDALLQHFMTVSERNMMKMVVVVWMIINLS